MGFFDALNSDEGRAGLAMLAAAGPQAQPMGFGQRMVMAQALQDAWGDNKQKRKMQEMQLKEAESQIRARDIAAQQATGKMQFLSNLFGPGAAGGGGAGPVAPAGAAGGGTSMPAMPGAAAPAAGPVSQAGGGSGLTSRLANMSADQVAAAKAMGFDFTDLWEKARNGRKRDPGAYYVMEDGSTQHFPVLQPGMTMYNGAARAIPGYGDAQAGMKAAEAGAVKGAELPYALALEQGKAGISAANDLVTVTLPDGRTLQLPRAQVLAMAGGQGQQPQLGQGGGLPGVGGGQQLSPALREFIAKDAAANGIQNPTTSFGGAGRGQAYGFRDAPAEGGQGGAQGLPGLQVQGPAGAAFQGATAKSDADQLVAWRDAATAANSSLETVRNLRAAVDKGVYSGGGAQAKTAASSLLFGLTGIKPQGLVGSEQYNAAASALVLDRVKALGANPSNADREFIERTVPSLQQSPEAQKALIDFIEKKSRAAMDLYRRADGFARQNNGLGGFDAFAQPQESQQGGGGSGKVVNFMDLK